jgi:3-deoxy-D-manno-octulosonate 8-phosphate phosphatase (KDO 8-P phosphatase)
VTSTENKVTPMLIQPCNALAHIRLLSCDVDGVMTDGGLYYSAEGSELRRFHVHDGLGLQNLQKAGIPVAIISQSTTSAIRHRAKHLGIQYCFLGVTDKVRQLHQLLATLEIDLDHVAHIGDDLNDLALLQCVGIAIAVPNAVPQILSCCKFVTKSLGGAGAIREVADAILESSKILQEHS